MVDLSRIRKGIPPPPPGPADLPPPPPPASESDLPSPAPPGRPPAREARGWVPPATGPAPPLAPLPGPAAAPGPGARPAPAPMKPVEPLPEPAAKAPPAREVTPLKLPETGGEPEREAATEIHGPPVFIKVDKYTDLIRSLQKLKTYAMSLRDALDALADIEKELATGISIGHKALDDFNTIIAVLDSKLLRAHSMEEFDAGSPGEMEKYIQGIHEQMEKIRSELKDIT